MAAQRERAAPFLYKTYDIVSDPEHAGVCGWASDTRRARVSQSEAIAARAAAAAINRLV